MAVGGPIKALTKFFAGLEKRRNLLVNCYVFAGAWIATHACIALFDRKSAKATQFNPVATRQGTRNLVKNRVDDLLDITLIDMRITVANLFYQFGFNHSNPQKT